MKVESFFVVTGEVAQSSAAFKKLYDFLTWTLRLESLLWFTAIITLKSHIEMRKKHVLFLEVNKNADYVHRGRLNSLRRCLASACTSTASSILMWFYFSSIQFEYFYWKEIDMHMNVNNLLLLMCSRHRFPVVKYIIQLYIYYQRSLPTLIWIKT